ncbi:MAG: PstS family phosphate ABC transporter substrate-binding protein [Solirubrobacterales bacterium]
MTSSRLIAVLASSFALAAGVAACGGGGGDTTGGGSVSGSIAIDGSSTVFPLTQAAAEAFQGENSGVQITVGESGTGGGFEKFCAGETQINDASRAIEPEEISACKKKGIPYTNFQVANDGISVVTNPDLGIKCLTTEQLKELWNKGSKITNYSQLGKDPETGKPLPDAPVSLYGPGTDSGTFDFFTDEINGAEGVSRSDYQPSEDDNVLVEGVAGDSDGLGYFGFSYYEQNQDKLNLVAVDSGKGCVLPAKKTIQDGTYTPLSRPLYIYPNTDDLKQAQVKAFVQDYVDNAVSYADTAQLVPLTPAQQSESKAALQKALG